MNIYVIRHGQTSYNLKKLYQGQTDIPLNKTGEQQAKKTAQKFRSLNIDNILVSPLTRTRQTARYISEVTGIIPEIEEELIERNFGDMEGKPNREDCNIQMLLDYNNNYSIYNIEPIQELFKRIYKCMDRIIEKYRNKEIVLVTHAGVAQAIECYFNGMPKDNDLEAVALKTGEIRKYIVQKNKITEKLL